ncbi:flagellar assembly protein FliW [Occultella glacieicola]|uniref:Flagellar assembly protein FliW n=1 Tax=Occultella glacieicola TaxID=2518684 RepID=A0ABY2E3Z1_9MICO|nr:flagellar assembly protein FliW [Occultella glacieicola]TDE94745.1 flagellar assembly protein FliW [Occultella glacieicola]
MSAVTFLSPPPGLAPHVEFELTPVPAATGLLTLTAPGADGLRLFLVDAQAHLSGYTPVLSAEQGTRLGLSDAAEAEVFVVANPAGEVTTVNLMAPVVVHRGSGAALQVILENQDWPLQHPLGEPVSPR